MSGQTSTATVLMLTLLFCFCTNCNCGGDADRLNARLACLKNPAEESFDIYLLDSVSYKFLSVTPACVLHYSTPCIGAVKQTPDAQSKFTMTLLSNGKVAFKASNGKYLSRIAYSNDAVDSYNHIQPAKSTADYFSQFVFDYDAAGSDFDNVGTITLRADNGRYIAPHSGTTIKPLSTTPHKFILLVAQSANSAAPNGGAEGYIAYYI